MAVTSRLRAWGWLLILVTGWVGGVQAAVLPEDRADVLYHSYDGGGITVDGPSVLVRKKATSNVSVSANYYVDTITSASIDVESTASEYTEEREQSSLSVDYLHEKTIFSLGYTASDENDFQARSVHVDVSQDFFGDLTTVSFGFSQGWDEITQTGNNEFFAEADRRHYRLSLSQIARKDLLFNITYETITDEGFLNNPYRQVRFLSNSSATGFAWEKEVYPNTRTSNALAFRAMYYLPYRAAVRTEVRAFKDTWNIRAGTAEMRYIHPLGKNWIVELRGRYYSQEKADFYQDLFSRTNETEFRARDKELSTFTSTTLGLGVTYQYDINAVSWLKKGSVNFYWDRLTIDYDDFRNVLADAPAGEEPLYSLDADVLRIYASLWF